MLRKSRKKQRKQFEQKTVNNPQKIVKKEQTFPYGQTELILELISRIFSAIAESLFSMSSILRMSA